MWRLSCLAIVILLTGCSKESMLRSALEDPQERHETLALTLKMFDDHPEYVDELFDLARDDPKAFGRLLDDTATALEDPAFAKDVAGHLVKSPEAVEQISLAILAESRSHPEMRSAIAAAILGSDEAVATILREHPEIVQRAMVRSVSP